METENKELITTEFKGDRLLSDVNTGEVAEVHTVQKLCNSRKAFWKCYLMDFLMILGIIDNRQVDVFIYIVENTNPSDNIFIGTYKQISDKTGCSSATIARIMKKLQSNNFIRKVQNGVWRVNPNILMKGNDHKKQILLTYYCADDKKLIESGDIENE